MQDVLNPRITAVQVLNQILSSDKTLDGLLNRNKNFETFSVADKNFIRLLLLTTLRHMGQIDGVLSKLMKKPLSAKQNVVQQILRLAVAQYLFLKTPIHAVVDTSVRLTKRLKFTGLSGLVNGVLRQLGRIPNPLENRMDLSVNIPAWLLKSWKNEYGNQTAEKMIPALLSQPPLDISVRENPELWAKKWQGQVLPTGSIRVSVSSPLDLDGFQKNCCWVQGASASVPAQLFSDVKGKKVLDMCAAPGGKTAQLVCRGGLVTAVDISENRLKRLKENMERLGLADKVSICVSDALKLEERQQYDAVLLDAPCSATGTIAHHPEVMFRQTQQDVLRLAELQKQMLLKAVQLVKSGGEIVFSTCSLQSEEGDSVVRFVQDYVQVMRPTQERWHPFLTGFGSLRFLPSQGYDGFYACLMRKI